LDCVVCHKTKSFEQFAKKQRTADDPECVKCWETLQKSRAQGKEFEGEEPGEEDEDDEDAKAAAYDDDEEEDGEGNEEWDDDY